MIGVANSLIPNELSELDSDFINYFGEPAGLWLPCDKHGARTPDFSGNLNYGTLNGGVITNNDGIGILKQSWKFDGSTGYISTPFTTITSYPFTLVAVGSTHLLSSTRQGALIQLVNGASPSTLGYASIEQNTTSICCRSANTGAANWSGYIDNAVMAFAAVFGASNDRRLYANGVLVASSTSSQVLGPINTLRIGITDTAGTTFLTGVVGFAAVFPFALTAAQVSALYSLLLYGEPFKLFQPSIFERLYSSSQPNIPLNLTSKSFVFSSSYAKQNINRSLRSETISQSEALGNISVQTLTQFQLLSFRRYSSQYFVQGGYSEDNGQ